MADAGPAPPRALRRGAACRIGARPAAGGLRAPPLPGAVRRPRVAALPYFVCPRIEALLRNTARLYDHADALWIDYGERRDFHRRAPESTPPVRRPAALGARVYDDPGGDDITFLVDFSAVDRRGARRGLVGRVLRSAGGAGATRAGRRSIATPCELDRPPSRPALDAGARRRRPGAELAAAGGLMVAGPGARTRTRAALRRAVGTRIPRPRTSLFKLLIMRR